MRRLTLPQGLTRICKSPRVKDSWILLALLVAAGCRGKEGTAAFDCLLEDWTIYSAAHHLPCCVSLVGHCCGARIKDGLTHHTTISLTTGPEPCLLENSSSTDTGQKRRRIRKPYSLLESQGGRDLTPSTWNGAPSRASASSGEPVDHSTTVHDIWFSTRKREKSNGHPQWTSIDRSSFRKLLDLLRLQLFVNKSTNNDNQTSPSFLPTNFVLVQATTTIASTICFRHRFPLPTLKQRPPRRFHRPKRSIRHGHSPQHSLEYAFALAATLPQRC